MSGFDVTTVCNRALQALGALPINAITDGSKNARECLKCYDPLRQSLLRAHPWNFATRFAALPAVVNPPNPPPANSLWANSFVYNVPSDYIRMVAVSPFTGSWLWEGVNYVWATDYFIQDGVIITWVNAPLNIRYGRDVTDVNLMDPIFREALAALMAQEMCEMLTQSKAKGERMTAAFTAKMMEARRQNAFEKPAGQTPTDEWLLARV